MTDYLTNHQYQVTAAASSALRPPSVNKLEQLSPFVSGHCIYTLCTGSYEVCLSVNPSRMFGIWCIWQMSTLQWQ